jgi:hypothetical protein
MARNQTTVDLADLASKITTTPFPNATKVYLTGSRPDIRVPFREIAQTDTLVINKDAPHAMKTFFQFFLYLFERLSEP